MTTALAASQVDELRRQAQNTSSQITSSYTALGLSLLIAYGGAASTILRQPSVPSGGHCDSGRVLQPNTISESELVRELVTFHNQLLATQIDLATDARQVLNEHLWDLYG